MSGVGSPSTCATTTTSPGCTYRAIPETLTGPTVPSGVVVVNIRVGSIASEVLPGQSFVVADDGELTYREMASLCVDLAAGFAALGLQPGERVGILLPNGMRWCATFFGAHAAGLSVVPLNTWYRRDELASVARRAGLRTIITQTEIFASESASAATGLDVAGYLGPLLWPAGAPRPVGLAPTSAP